MIRACLFASALLFTISPNHAEAGPVDALLVTGIDVSGSINAPETALQIDGVAEALRSPSFLSAIQHGENGRIAMMVFAWADGGFPVLLAWQEVGTAEEAESASRQIEATLNAIIANASRDAGTLTNLSEALRHAKEMLDTSPFPAPRHVVNIIGNGEDNSGEGPTNERANLLATGATINGVVIGGDPKVINYYRNSVIGGRGAFVLTASKPEDIAGTMMSKFIQDIASAQ